jgi:protein-L-isoaspartate(D-aspartate) O-methyltransferase
LSRPRRTAGAELERIYVDRPFGLDPEQDLNSGLPSFVARCIEELSLREGDRVVQIGCGVGYFTAILAHLVGSTGRVEAYEIHPKLAEHARDVLAAFPQVKVHAADATSVELAECDAMISHCGVAELPARWLDALAVKARAVIPLVVPVRGRGVGSGAMLRIDRSAVREYRAKFFHSVNIFICAGATSKASIARLKAAIGKKDRDQVALLRRDAHDLTRECWLHGESVCLSRAPS